jgi:hypothetical protein
VLRLHPNPAPVTVRLARLAVAAVLLAACQGPPRTARAVVIDTISGTGNTSAPADDPGWKNVGVRGIGTGVYLGNDWVLTAYHVGGGSIVLGGGTYAMLANSGTRLTNAGAAGRAEFTDLYMFRLATTPTGLGGVTIASAASGTGAAVTMIGAGRDRGAFTRWSVNTRPATRRSPRARGAGEPTSSAARACGSTTISARSRRFPPPSTILWGVPSRPRRRTAIPAAACFGRTARPGSSPG